MKTRFEGTVDSPTTNSWSGARRKWARRGQSRSYPVQVFKGNTSDPATVGPVIEKLRHRFGLSRVVLVGDRGMLTQARIRDEVQPSDWIGSRL